MASCLKRGIYKIVFELKTGQYALDADTDFNLVIIRKANDSKSQMWYVEQDNEKSCFRIWNAERDGGFLCSEVISPEGIEAGSSLILNDNPEHGDWDVIPFEDDYKICPIGKNLVVMLDADPEPDGTRAVNLQIPYDPISHWTKLTFEQVEPADPSVTPPYARMKPCHGTVPIFSSNRSTPIRHSWGIFKLTPRPTLNGGAKYLLGATNRFDPIFLIGVWPDNERQRDVSQKWYFRYDDRRRCFTIQHASSRGEFLCWTDFNLGSGLTLSENRRYWEIYEDTEGSLSIRVPYTKLCLSLDTLPGDDIAQPAISLLHGVSLYHDIGYTRQRTKWVLQEDEVSVSLRAGQR